MEAQPAPTACLPHPLPVREAKEATGCHASVVYVPPPFAAKVGGRSSGGRGWLGAHSLQV